jgi:hypothetical protein
MSVESERQDENRSDEHGEGSGEQTASRGERASDEPAVYPAQRHGSLNQRLQHLQSEYLPELPHVSALQPVDAPAMHFPPFDQFDEPPRPPQPAGWPVRGLLMGLGASLCVGLLLVGWVKRADIVVAWRSSPKSTIDLYPPREEPAPTKRVTVTVAESAPNSSPPPQVTAVISPPRSEVPGAAEGSAFAGPCGAVVGQPEPGFVRLRLADASRAGGALLVKVDDIDYSGKFAADGTFSLVVPRLSATAAVRWAGLDGRPCSTPAPDATGEAPQLRVALVWEGAAPLGLHILEPKAWLGSTTGHISAAQPNSDLSRGAGRMHVFGGPGDPARVAFYSVELARLGSPGILSAVVKLETATAESCSSPDRLATIRYQLHTARTGQGTAPPPEVRAFAFQLPACGKGDVALPAERIAIRF